MVRNKILKIEDTLALMSKNVARYLNLNQKGEIKVGNDADLCVFDEELNLYDVIAKGEFCVKDEKVVKKGFFE